MTQKDNQSVLYGREPHMPVGKPFIIEDDYSQLSDAQKVIVELFRRKTENKRLAARPDFDPAEILEFLPSISIMDIEMASETDVARIKVRLFGTALVDFYGEWTGRIVYDVQGEDSLQQVFPDTYNRVVLLANTLIEARKPILLCNKHVSIDKSHWKVNHLAIPFSKDNGKVDQIFIHTELIK